MGRSGGGNVARPIRDSVPVGSAGAGRPEPDAVDVWTSQPLLAHRSTARHGLFRILEGKEKAGLASDKGTDARGTLRVARRGPPGSLQRGNQAVAIIPIPSVARNLHFSFPSSVTSLMEAPGILSFFPHIPRLYSPAKAC